MEFKDIKSFNYIESDIKIEAFNPKKFEYENVFMQDAQSIIIDGNLYKCSIKNEENASSLDLFTSRGWANLCRLKRYKDNIKIQIKAFANKELRFKEDINILISDEILTKNKLSLSDLNGSAYLDKYYLLLKNYEDEDNFTESFVLAINSSLIHIKLVENEIGETFAEVIRVQKVSKELSEKKPKIVLLNAKINFTSKEVFLSVFAKHEFSKLIKNEDSYMKAWDKYGDEEGEILLSRAREVGALYIDKIEIVEGGNYRFYFKTPVPQILIVDDSIPLDITYEMPFYLENNDSECKETVKELFKKFKKEKQDKPLATLNIKKCGENFIDFEHDSIASLPSEFDIDTCFFVMSLAGEKAQIKRREHARDRIIAATAANPQLSLLIENPDKIRTSLLGKKKIPALSTYVSKKIFSINPPTATQEKAIEVALNTTDIALIQGPPGTGKTTVINAIIERLAEISDAKSQKRGSVLLSAFQHCAVENAKDRIFVNGLPTVKFGGKSNSVAEDIDLNVRKLSEQLHSDLNEKFKGLKRTETFLDIENEYRAYLNFPNKEKAIALLDKAIQSLSLSKDNSLLSEIEKVKSNLDSQSKAMTGFSAADISLVRKIRVSELAFNDDGIFILSAILKKFGDYADSNILSELKSIISSKAYDKNKLINIKEYFYDLVIPKAEFQLEKPNGAVLDLIEKSIKSIEDSLSPEEKINRVILDYLENVNDNTYGVKEALKDLNFVYAATVQQCEGVDIRFYKNPDAKKNPDKLTEAQRNIYDSLQNFDTVIIDEAARSTPRDLMIPMVKGKKRIILVGDQRQLPHMIEEEIVRKITIAEADDSADTEASNAIEKKLKEQQKHYLEESIFSYLFNQLKGLEKRDGVKRTITLDAQYRMNPILGQFVSDNFYKANNEAFKSPLDSSYFNHKLNSYKDKCAIWLDIPASKDISKRDGTSWVRLSEVELIVKKISEILAEDTSKKLTIGVISFYKAQINKIGDRIRKSFSKEELERISVGTVDSFQGMEFDIVFLSAVRSAKNINKKFTGLRLFGHLTSVNRLCVAMSRQKKLLFVVGDSAYYDSEKAKEAVPAMYNFYHLCRDNKGVLYEQ